MSEVILNVTDEFIKSYSFQIRGEIVRCRDCKEFSFRDDEYATADWCDYWGAEVESLDGFCAWGERRNE